MKWRTDPDGWAPIYRRIRNSNAWKGRSLSTKIVIIWVIMSIRHLDDGINPAGCCDTSVETISQECEISDTTTRRALRELQEAGVVDVRRRNHGITIELISFHRWAMVEDSSVGDLSEPTADSSVGDRQIFGPDIIEEAEEGSSVRPSGSQKRVVPPSAKIETPRVEGYKETIACFHERYVAAYGAEPTWGGEQGAQLKRLLAAHGATEVQRRIAVLFDTPPRWLSGPYTFKTLVANFDALVPVQQRQPARRDGGLSPAEVMGMARNFRKAEP